MLNEILMETLFLGSTAKVCVKSTTIIKRIIFRQTCFVRGESSFLYPPILIRRKTIIYNFIPNKKNNKKMNEKTKRENFLDNEYEYLKTS